MDNCACLYVFSWGSSMERSSYRKELFRHKHWVHPEEYPLYLDLHRLTASASLIVWLALPLKRCASVSLSVCVRVCQKNLVQREPAALIHSVFWVLNSWVHTTKPHFIESKMKYHCTTRKADAVRRGGVISRSHSLLRSY